MNLSKFMSTTPEKTTSDEVALLILRVAAGMMMAFGHGLGKIPPSEGLISGVTALGFPAPALFAWLAALAEFGGGILLALGLLTRVNAFLLAFTMLVAAFGVHLADPFKVKELSLLYMVIYVLYMVRGSGRLSLDHLLFGKK